jgi:Lon protease-like protein
MNAIPLFPLNTVFFPDGALPLRIFEVRYLDMIGKCLASGGQFGVVALTRGSEVRTPEGQETFSSVGTMARILSSESPMSGLMQIACIGTSRFEIIASEQQKNGLWMAEVNIVADDRRVEVPDELQNTADALDNLIESLIAQGVPPKDMPVVPPYRYDECGWVANRWAEMLPISLTQKQQLLMLDNPLLRLELVQDILDAQGLLGG